LKKADWNLWFFVPLLVALAAGGAMLAFIEKGQDVLFVNRFHSPFWDYLFYYGTLLGDGLLYLAVAIGLLWKNFRNALIAFVCFSLTGTLVQFFKKIIFTEMMRPAALLADEPLHFVEGVKILKHYSFPSGHTAMAFSLFCLLSQFVKTRWLGLLFLIMALIGGISRIYLVQHFFEDVYSGAILGVSITSLVWHWFSARTAFSELSGKSLSAYFRKA